MGPVSALRRRVGAWWAARLQPSGQWHLTQRTIYIIPTRAGLAFGATLAVLLLASINYQLNLGYALTFLLTGSALVSIQMTHGSLRGLTLHLKPAAAVFAGQAAVLEVVATNPGRERLGLGFGVATRGFDALAWSDIAAHGQTQVTITHVCERRGAHRLPVLRVECRFPFGLFRAWTLWRPAGQLWVYPAPERPAPELPAAHSTTSEGAGARSAGGAELDGVRPWQRGDSARQIVWKKVAHTGELVSRETSESTRRHLWLDWYHTPRGDPEARLSRLAAWTLAADARGLPYGMRLPGWQIAPAWGAAQRDSVLRALAQFEP